MINKFDGKDKIKIEQLHKTMYRIIHNQNHSMDDVRNYTLVIFKPNVFNVKDRYINMIKDILSRNYSIINFKIKHMNDLKLFRRLYIEHKEKPFYQWICSFMDQGITIMLLLKSMLNDLKAVEWFWDIIGHWNLSLAKLHTIWGKFYRPNIDKEVFNNLIHASSDVLSFWWELKIIFDMIM